MSAYHSRKSSSLFLDDNYQLPRPSPQQWPPLPTERPRMSPSSISSSTSFNRFSFYNDNYLGGLLTVNPTKSLDRCKNFQNRAKHLYQQFWYTKYCTWNISTRSTVLQIAPTITKRANKINLVFHFFPNNSFNDVSWVFIIAKKYFENSNNLLTFVAL